MKRHIFLIPGFFGFAKARPGKNACIQLIGHSTGGLDARLLLTPAVDLATGIDAEAYASTTG